MNVDELKEKIKIAHEAVADEPEPYKIEAFKIILESLVRADLTSEYGIPPVPSNVGIPLVGTTNAGTPSDGILILAQNCQITCDELKNVILIKENKIEIICPIKGKDLEKIVTVALCILASHEVIFKQEWVTSYIIAESCRSKGVQGLANLAAILKRNSDLFLKRPTSNEYKLNTKHGRDTAYQTIKKLAKGET